MASQEKHSDADTLPLDASPFAQHSSSNHNGASATAMWGDLTGTADVANEPQTDDSTTNVLRSFYKSAFDFPDLSSSLADGAPEAPTKPLRCSPFSQLATCAVPSAIAGTGGVPTAPSSASSDGMQSVPVVGSRWCDTGTGNLPSMVVSDVTFSPKDNGAPKLKCNNHDNVKVASLSGGFVHVGPVMMHARPSLGQKIALPDNTSSSPIRGTLGITRGGTNIDRRDGVASPVYNVIGAPRQPPPLPRHQNVLETVHILERYPTQSKTSCSSASQGLSILFKSGLDDCDSIVGCGNKKDGNHALDQHRSESIEMPLPKCSQSHNMLLRSPQQSLLDIDELAHSERSGANFLASGSRRIGNAHGGLQGALKYVPYNLSPLIEDPLLSPEGPLAASNKEIDSALLPINGSNCELSKCQVLPVFIQMFPCELRDRTIIVLNRVVEATCGPDVATVVGIEPRSETSFITLVRTNEVWLLIHKLRCRVLMDRHGFWYAENMEQYLRLKEYCEGVRRLPQQMRHFQTDGLPCMPLVVELSRSVNAAAVTSPPAPPSFDSIAPIATMERHRVRSRQRQ